MRIISKLAVAVSMFVATSAFAAPALNTIGMIQSLGQAMATSGLNWKVGDTANYNLGIESMGAIGTVKMAVTADTAEGFTLTQDVDAMGQKQNMVALVDKNTGKILKLTVNGQPQEIPADTGEHIVKQEQAHLTVPAGAYDCIHLIIEDNQKQQSEMWINPLEIPIAGLLKSIQTQQGMKISLELTSFAKGN